MFLLSIDTIAFLNYMIDSKEFKTILENFENDYKRQQHIKFKESIERDIINLIKDITKGLI